MDVIFVVRLLLAAILGAAVGVQREIAGRAAGIRTYSLVALGSASFTILSIYAFFPGDPGRVAAQILTGIGFIGAGIILHKPKEVVGLTTAAGIWVSAAIGMAAGSGKYFIGIATAIFTIIIFVLQDNVVRKTDKNEKEE